MKPNISPNFRHRDVIARAVKHRCLWHPYDNFPHKVQLQEHVVGTDLP